MNTIRSLLTTRRRLGNVIVAALWALFWSGGFIYTLLTH